MRRVRQPDPVHHLREVISLRHRDDPEERWRCCANWQRTLGNKWNSREFATKHGCRVPALYWSGSKLSALPWSTLPDRYAIRPAFAGGRQGTYVIVDGCDLLRDVRHTAASLAGELRRTHRWRWFRPTLVEEFVQPESAGGQLPIECKFYMFGETVGAIEIVRRVKPATTQVFYTEHWTRMADPMMTRYAVGSDLDPPACLPEMLTCARRLGTAFGAHVRVDLYAGSQGAVFSEFSNRPHGGRFYTPFAQEYLGRLWEEARHDESG